MKSKARQKARLQRKRSKNEFAAENLVANFPKHLNHKLIAGFAPIGDEIDIWPLLHQLYTRGRRVCLPITPVSPTPLTFRQWTPESEMATDRYGVSFPVAGSTLTPDFILVPLLAFTADGRRLGYGGGYYDRTLAKLRAESEVFACGVAYAGQEVPDVPTDEHDARLDGILTEDYFRKF